MASGRVPNPQPIRPLSPESAHTTPEGRCALAPLQPSFRSASLGPSAGSPRRRPAVLSSRGLRRAYSGLSEAQHGPGWTPTRGRKPEAKPSLSAKPVEPVPAPKEETLGARVELARHSQAD
jgi:hypothetical protein